MKNISYWAKDNIIKSRLLITAILVFQFIIGMFLGLTWFANDIFIGKEWEVILLILFIGTIFIYPIKKRDNYKFRKTCDFALLNIMFFLTIIFSNQLPTKLGIDHLATTSRVTKDYQVNLVVLKEKNSGASSIDKKKNINKKPRAERKKLKRELKQKLKAQLKKMRGDKKRVGLLVFLSILLVLVTVTMFYIGIFILCSLSCSGTVAPPLLLLGMANAGVIIGIIVGLTKIVKERRRLKKEATIE